MSSDGWGSGPGHVAVSAGVGPGAIDPAERAARGKEARAAVPRRFAGASKYTNMGQRVVAGQRPDAGHQRHLPGLATDRDRPGRAAARLLCRPPCWKYSINIETLVPRGMRIYREMCGWTPARAHARSADRIAIAAYLGDSDVFDQAITRFAAAYADQNERDHKSLVHAVASEPDHCRTRPVRPPLARVAQPSAVQTGVHRGGWLRGARRWPSAPERPAPTVAIAGLVARWLDVARPRAVQGHHTR